MRPRPGGLTVVLLVAGGALLAGCQLGSPSDDADPSRRPSSRPSPTTPTEAVRPPSRMSCYLLTYEQAVAPTTDVASVPCSRQHTAVTYAVGELETVVDGHLLAVDARGVRDQVARDCRERVGEYLGATERQLRLSALRAVWFSPTLEQADAGHDWYRCDVIALAGEGSLARLNGTLRGVLANADGRRDYGICADSEPGTPDSKRIACTQRHGWRAVDSFDVTGEKYPGEDAVRTTGQDYCKRAVQRLAEDSLNFMWGYDWPTEGQFAAGQRYGLCWAPA